MQDSLELPEQYDEFPAQELLSPPQPNLDSKHTTPPHSLAYSNSTCAKDKLRELQMRSPLEFQESPTKMGLIKTNNQNYPLNEQRTIPISPQKQDISEQRQREINNKPASRSQYKKIQPKGKMVSKSPQKTDKVSPHIKKKQQSQPRSPEVNPFPERKTVAKSKQNSLLRRVKELEQALHMETVVSEEMRTKLSVTNSLLQSKMKEQGLGYLLSMKNSSRDLKNIDIFVELTNLQKTLTEKNIINDRLKSQLKQLQLQNQKLRTKKQNSPLPRSPNRTLNQQLQKLIEEKQSLMGYIDEQKNTLKRKIDYIAELEEEINRLSDKETHYANVERPKLVNELSQIKLENRSVKEELERVKMEYHLCEIKAASDDQQFGEKLSKLEETVLHQQQVIKEYKQKEKSLSKVFASTEVQKQDIQHQILLKQLTLLKNQRDYYLKEYRLRSNQEAELYSLRLKLSLLQSSS